MKKTLLISNAAVVLTLLAGASAAQARDGEKNFEGAKVGVQAGWEQRKIDEVLLPAPDDIRLDDKSSGFSYGGFVGYDKQFDQFVLGVEADFSPNGKTLRSTLTTGDTVTLDSKWAASVSARAGFTLTPKLLAYGRVGYGINRYEVSSLAAGATTSSISDNATGDGLVYGGGLEYAVNPNVSMRVEYRRDENDLSLRTQKVLGGLTVRF